MAIKLPNLVLIASLLISPLVQAENIRLAVTASFRPVIEALRPSYEAQSGHRLVISSASTGVLYHQIQSGAPFDLFLAADQERPELLKQNLNLGDGSTGTYAIGALVLVHDDSVTSLTQLSGYSGKVVIANPAVAPYGKAAEDYLNGIGFQGQKVLATNVSQAVQYLDMGLVSLGLVAASIVPKNENIIWLEDDAVAPIRQDYVKLSQREAVENFVKYLKSAEIQQLYKDFGYRVVDQ